MIYIQVICTALCSALTDASVLVQRSALELLLQVTLASYSVKTLISLTRVCLCTSLNLITVTWSASCPPSSSLSSGNANNILFLLVNTKTLVTLLRRDMSLNRRLFTWLLGTEINPSLYPSCHPLADKSLCYFTTFSSDLLILALLRLLELAVDSPNMRPFRIITTLLDKAEIGPVIIDRQGEYLLEMFKNKALFYKNVGILNKNICPIGQQKVFLNNKQSHY